MAGPAPTPRTPHTPPHPPVTPLAAAGARHRPPPRRLQPPCEARRRPHRRRRGCGETRGTRWETPLPRGPGGGSQTEDGRGGRPLGRGVQGGLEGTAVVGRWPTTPTAASASASAAAAISMSAGPHEVANGAAHRVYPQRAVRSAAGGSTRPSRHSARDHPWSPQAAGGARHSAAEHDRHAPPLPRA
eukprot:TRINITY_DN2922_c1_g1_i1.p2 TRINITY_DN2922_c1_g1~~TRINITY_DN2922_c1_g1_i1.p2  ORF type:complete len:213 (+),score=13.82 TRINITY_DN2922_c1_g1_i1:80-640(+)